MFAVQFIIVIFKDMHQTSHSFSSTQAHTHTTVLNVKHKQKSHSDFSGQHICAVELVIPNTNKDNVEKSRLATTVKININI